MAKPLFLPPVDPHTFFEKEASIGKMPDDEKNWPAHILSMLHEQLPFLSNFTVNILIQRMEPEAGFAFGYAMILRKSDPRVSTPSKNVENGIRIPIIVADRQLQPFHTFELNGNVMPLTPDRVEAAMMNPSMFDGPASRPKSQKSLVDQLYPPYQQRQGFGLTNTGTNTGGISKVSSAPADLMAGDVSPKDLRTIAKLKETERSDRADAQLSLKDRLGRAGRAAMIPVAAGAALTGIGKGRAAFKANRLKGMDALRGMDAIKHVGGAAQGGALSGAATGAGISAVNTGYQEMARRKRDKTRQRMGLESTNPALEKQSAAPSMLRSSGIGALAGGFAGGVNALSGSESPLEDGARGAVLGGAAGGLIGGGANFLRYRKFNQALAAAKNDLSDAQKNLDQFKDLHRVGRDRVGRHRDQGRLDKIYGQIASGRGRVRDTDLDEMNILQDQIPAADASARKALRGMGLDLEDAADSIEIDAAFREANRRKSAAQAAVDAQQAAIAGMTPPEAGAALQYGIPAAAGLAGLGIGRATQSPQMKKESSLVKEALARLDFSPNRRIPSSMVLGQKSKVKMAPGVTPMSIHFFPVMGTKFVVGVDSKLAAKLGKMKDQNEIRRALVGPMKSEVRAARGGRPSPGMFMLFVKSKNGYAYQSPKAMRMSA